MLGGLLFNNIIMTTFRTIKLDSDNAVGDAFGRVRVSNPITYQELS
jgi:hypothetical protein